MGLVWRQRLVCDLDMLFNLVSTSSREDFIFLPTLLYIVVRLLHAALTIRSPRVGRVRSNVDYQAQLACAAIIAKWRLASNNTAKRIKDGGFDSIK